jgi:hypothetical protein
VKEHRQLQADLRRLQRQREEASRTLNEDPAKSISDFYHTLLHLRTEFHKREPQDKRENPGADEEAGEPAGGKAGLLAH